ncbi:MAG: hypothetical protein KC410_19545 [Anaerolineales bacterium]|nr:hypothetical protein [Anaerolineales bacterium]
MLDKITLYMNLPLMLTHELCHYAVARLLRMRVKFHSHYVTFYPDDSSDRRVILVMLAPALFGFMVVLGLAMVAILSAEWLIIPAAVVLGVCWQLSCLSDLSDVYHFIRLGEWPAKIQQAPELPQTLADWLHQ